MLNIKRNKMCVLTRPQEEIINFCGKLYYALEEEKTYTFFDMQKRFNRLLFADETPFDDTMYSAIWLLSATLHLAAVGLFEISYKGDSNEDS